MEADWAVEVGSNLPGIELPWEGFVDLRLAQSAIGEIVEAGSHPALLTALSLLNSEASPLFTSKCDVWTLRSDEIDPDEFDANAEDARAGFASYIDILQLDPEKFASFEYHEGWVRSLTAALRAIALSNGRVDFVVRAAAVDSKSGYGLTLYAAGCGRDDSTASAAWEAVLHAAVTATIKGDASPHPAGE
jgi:hypothetical protein